MILNNTTLQSHEGRIKEILFSSNSAYPPWLGLQAEACNAQYSGFGLIPQFRSAISAFSDRSVKPFELFVLGEGKFGKSTLVNALLGEVRSKTRGLPETRCFLRYEIVNNPRSECSLFMRVKPGTHDWITRRVRGGRTVPELYEILQYSASAAVAKSVLEEECRLLDRGAYEPALFEIERQVSWSSRSAFPVGVRIVDTQGLDQLFPDDLQQLGSNAHDPDITKRFMDWMSNTPRGKHIEWQFRRCDAVLWCVNAKRIGSAATDASLKYFARYSKKIVIALTNIDLVARSERDHARILERAHQVYGDFAVDIVPINGQMALEAALQNAEEKKTESGLKILVNSLTKACVTDAAITRSVSRYLGLRVTESQFRSALETMLKDLLILEKKYHSDLGRMDKARTAEVQKFQRWQSGIVLRAKNDVFKNIEYIDLSDDRYSVQRKMQIDEFVATIRLSVQNYFAQQLIPSAKSYAQSIKPYLIPMFDAEGQKAGHLKKIEVDPVIPSISTFHLSLSVYLENEIFTRAMLWLKKNLLGYFSQAKKLEAIEEENRLIFERQAYVKSEFLESWEETYKPWALETSENVSDLFGPISDEIDSVLSEIESTEGEEIGETCARIQKALRKRGSNLVLFERFVSVMKNGYA